MLLKTQARDPRGWLCKLSDFGCVRLMRTEEDGAAFPHFTVTRALGTLTHMVGRGVVCKEFDCKAFDCKEFDCKEF